MPLLFQPPPMLVMMDTSTSWPSGVKFQKTYSLLLIPDLMSENDVRVAS